MKSNKTWEIIIGFAFVFFFDGVSGLYSLRCPLGDGWWYWGGKCYLIDEKRKVAWSEAQELCRRFKDTNLLEIQSLEEKVRILKRKEKPYKMLVTFLFKSAEGGK